MWVYLNLLVVILSLSGPLHAAPVLIDETLSSESFSDGLLISEVLADPSRNLTMGDANRDGSVSSSADEFVELFNIGTQPVDVSGFLLSDRIKTRHVFPEGSLIDAGETLLVFGGGDLSAWQGQGLTVQGASTGSLGLNNSGDHVSLLSSSGESIVEIMYSREAGQDQSLELFGGDLFRPHQTLLDSLATAHSAGSLLTHQAAMVADRHTPHSSASSVPEPNILILLLLAGLTLGLRSTLKLKNARFSPTL